LHNVTLAPKYDYITAQVVGGSGGGFSHSATINVGREGGVEAGAVALDGGGVVGRVVSLGNRASRVLLVTDLASRVPVKVEGTGSRRILVGDNTGMPILEFATEIEEIKPGQLVVTSSDGGVFPKGLPIGEVVRTDEKTLRVRVAANFDRLEFVRILLDRTDRTIDADAVLIVSPRSTLRPNSEPIANPDADPDPEEATE
ncbi:UNVERIFIED_CONTAM: hypothetical protein GTU68_012702, partial [Idotea baltica]|nr:hypothetical protein [Idotea baltica]